MSKATETVAPPNLSCHPERSEGSLCLLYHLKLWPLLSSHVILSAAKDLCARRVRPFPFAEFTLERSEGLRAAAPALRRDHRRHGAWRSRWSPWNICLRERLWWQPLRLPCSLLVMLPNRSLDVKLKRDVSST